MEYPLVSAIIPTYKRSEFLQRAVKSVVNQSYSNIEIIIVDDNDGDNEYRRNTKDNVLPLLEKSKKSYSYLEHEKNRGIAAARNTGIKYASGVFIAFLDDDDEWLNNKIEMQVALLTSLDEKYGIIGCKWHVWREEVNQPNERTPNHSGNLNGILSVNHFSPPSMWLIKSNVFMQGNMFDEDNRLKSREDVELLYRLSRHCYFEYVPEVLVNYYLHKGSISKNHDIKITAILYFLNKHKLSLSKNKKALSEIFEMLGELEIAEGKGQDGIKNLAKAIFLRPKRYQILAKILLSLSGSTMYRYFRKI